MLYIISLVKDQRQTNKDAIALYGLIDTLSDSRFKVSADQLKTLISRSGGQIGNAKIHDNNIQTSDWVSNLLTEYMHNNKEGDTENIASSHVLISKREYMYKIVSYYGGMEEFTYEELVGPIQRGKVANCSIVNNKLVCTDNYEIKRNPEFEKDIEHKYASYEAKALMLGLRDTSFEYEVENQQVKIVRYTGSGSNVILPHFITAIKKGAFRQANINTIQLNEGLESIGDYAFAQTPGGNDGLTSIEIPSTVKIIGPKALSCNSKLFTPEKILHTDRFTLRNNKTVVLRQY